MPNFEDHFGMCDRPTISRRRNPLQEDPSLLKSPRLILNHPARGDGFAAEGGGTTTKSRVFTHTTDYYGDPLPSTQNFKFETTKEASNQQALQAKQATPPPPKSKCMIPDQVALQERLDTYMPDGKPPAEASFRIGGTCKRTVPSLSKETTNQFYYETLPKQQREERPDYYETDKRFAHTATLNRERKAEQDPRDKEVVSRRRGELTRNPKESGNPYGISVFVDEYAKWGTQLQGRTKRECDSRATTKYF